MKTSFAVSTLLSGVIFAMLSMSMGGCQRSMVVDPQGKLVDPPSEADTPGQLKAFYTWHDHLKPFEYLKPRVIPGDRLDYFDTWVTIPYVVRVDRYTLVVTRDGREYLRARSGHALFWTTMVGVSLIPMAVWSVIAVWIATVSPRRDPSTRLAARSG